MEYREIIFYLALFLSIVCVAEIYVRIKGLGIKVEKIRGEPVPTELKLAKPILLFIAAVVTTLMTMPH